MNHCKGLVLMQIKIYQLHDFYTLPHIRDHPLVLSCRYPCRRPARFRAGLAHCSAFNSVAQGLFPQRISVLGGFVIFLCKSSELRAHSYNLSVGLAYSRNASQRKAERRACWLDGWMIVWLSDCFAANWLAASKTRAQEMHVPP